MASLGVREGKVLARLLIVVAPMAFTSATANSTAKMKTRREDMMPLYGGFGSAEVGRATREEGLSIG